MAVLPQSLKKMSWHDVVKFVVDGKRECIGLSCAVDVKGILLAGMI